MPSRITVAVCVPIAGVGSSGRPLPGGTMFLAISGILFFARINGKKTQNKVYIYCMFHPK